MKTETVLGLSVLILLGARQSRADILLNLVNPPGGQNNTPYSLNFIAGATTTDISFAGYCAPGPLFAEHISLTSGSGNLLGQTWTFTPFFPFDTIDAGQFNDGFGPGTNGLFFANDVGDLDRFNQVISTVVGQTYTLDFLFSNLPAPNNAPSELIVSATTAVPEPSSIILLGPAVASVGLCRRRRFTSPASMK